MGKSFASIREIRAAASLIFCPQILISIIIIITFFFFIHFSPFTLHYSNSYSQEVTTPVERRTGKKCSRSLFDRCCDIGTGNAAPSYYFICGPADELSLEKERTECPPLSRTLSVTVSFVTECHTYTWNFSNIYFAK